MDSADDPSGLASTGSAWVRYWRGRSTRSFQAEGNGYVNYDNLSASNFIGGQASLGATTAIGRRSSLTGAAGGRYNPVDFIDALRAPGDTTQSGDGMATAPIDAADQRVLAMFGAVEFTHQWTPRQSLETQYSHGRSEAVGDWGVQSSSHRARVSHSWSARPSVRLRGQYHYDVTLQSQRGIEELPTVYTHTTELGFEYDRRLSPSRSMQFTARGGTTFVEGTELSNLVAAGASFRLDVSRNWQLVSNADRSTTILAGVTSELFVSNQFSANLNGLIGSAMSVGVGGSYAQGTGFNVAAGFDAISGSADLQYRFAGCCSVFTSYGFYRHHLRNQAPSIGPAPPPFLENHSARVGFSIWLPLFGLF